MTDKIINIIQEILEENVNKQTTVDNCPSWTSLKMLQIVMALEEIGVVIPIEKIAQIHSVSDIINMAEK